MDRLWEKEPFGIRVACRFHIKGDYLTEKRKEKIQIQEVFCGEMCLLNQRLLLIEAGRGGVDTEDWSCLSYRRTAAARLCGPAL